MALQLRQAGGDVGLKAVRVLVVKSPRLGARVSCSMRANSPEALAR
jgi:hypothetical protein